MLARYGRTLVIALVCGITLVGCGPHNKSVPQQPEQPAQGAVFRVLSGAENQALEPLVQSFAKSEHLNVEMTYAGSVDIMLELGNGIQSDYDAVWPANSMWIQLGDTSKSVQITTSIYRSPVVF